MAYFDRNKHTEVTTDASQWGLSAILSQCMPGANDRGVVAYKSRSLSDVEDVIHRQSEKRWQLFGPWNDYMYIYVSTFHIIH